MGYISYLVRQYIPPPIRCYKCQRFGHVAVQCRGKHRCAKCGGEHEYGKCGDKAVLKCCNCGGDHSAAYGGCEKQKEARELQKFKITNKVSYAEALKEIVNEKKDNRSDVPTSIPEQAVSKSYTSRANISRMNDRNHLKGRIQQVSRLSTPNSESCECTEHI